jgi:CheY-like chemotaxis protein
MVPVLETFGRFTGDVDTTSVRCDEPSSAIAGQEILIVEDQALIALDMEGLLLGLGARECWLVPSVSDALKLLDTTRLTLAVVDFNLGHETSEAVADRLTALAVPFVFFTGYGERLLLPDRFAGVPIVSKPIVTETLLAKIAKAQLGAAPQTSTCPHSPLSSKA